LQLPARLPGQSTIDARHAWFDRLAAFYAAQPTFE